VSWSNPGTAGNPVVPGYYVYTGEVISPMIATIKVGTTDTNAIGPLVYSIKENTPVVTSFAGPYTTGNTPETITFTIVENSGENKNRIDVGDYVAHVSGFSVSGNNVAGATLSTNFTFTQTGDALDCAYSIAPAIITIALDSQVIEKEYDGNDDTPDNKADFTLQGSKVPANSSVTLSNGHYNNKNVGTGKLVTYSASLANNGNYAFSWSKSGDAAPTVVYSKSVSANIGTITAKAVTITLNVRNRQVYKTYDGGVVYATWANNAAASTPNRRAGQGFSVSGIVSGEPAGTVLIDVAFAEADTDRSDFDAYVNNVYEPTTGNYAIGGRSGNTFYKKLVFTVTGTSSGNYIYSVAGGGNTFLSGRGTSFTLFDSRDTTNASNNGQSGDINIAILTKSITPNYTNQTQSYANADNTFNTNWELVGGTLPTGSSGVASGDSITLNVTNGWRYEEGTDSGTHVKTYDKYTTFTGRAGNALLGATLSSSNGKHLNYTLRKQPTLTIGYFVVIGDAYQVGSMAGLMLATDYYRMNFVDTSTEGTGTNVVPTVTVWKQITTNDIYESGTGYPSTYSSDSWDDYFSDFMAAYNADKADEDKIEIILEGNNWGYYVSQPIDRTKYLKFIQVSNISGVLSSSDILILRGQFGDDWSSVLTNFIGTSAGNVVTAIGAFFKNQTVGVNTVPFIGEYDGAGYTIDNVNIMGYATSSTTTTYNIGMFESVGESSVTVGTLTVNGNGLVKDINLRNWNIVFSDGNSVNDTINVGGIIALSEQQNTLSNSSFHGIINVYSANGTINVGGLVGKYVGADNIVAFNGAIALGSIYSNATTVNAGGIVGNFGSSSSTVNDVVAMMGIFSTAAASNTIGGLVGTSSNLNVLTASTGKENAYVHDSVVNANGSGTAVNKQVGNSTIVDGVTYSELITGSTSGYADGSYLGSGHTSAQGKYDMIVDGIVDSSALRESQRLVDIIKIYVLLYSKSTTTSGSGQEAKTVYRVSSTSNLVGSALGTNGNPIVINNIQQVAYLREFRFATFTLARDINMYTAYSQLPFGGAFYGTVNANSHKINLRDSSSAKMFAVELSGHVLPIVIDENA
jgi:hypothetical protein